jgi:ABC-type glycerol-3-phosphate transport system substrate-binding protein
MLRWVLILVLTGIAVACGGGVAGSAADQGGTTASSAAGLVTPTRVFEPVPGIVYGASAPQSQ